MRRTFRALRSRNYRLFFGGQTLSLIGTWMESIAMSWLVYRLTGSELLLGTVAFSSQIPMFFVSPFAGLVSDRYDRRKILITTQIVFAILSAILAGLVLTNLIQVWEIIVLSVAVGVTSAFDNPARQALVPDLVEDREDLANAIALNSTQFNIARLIGPAIAGFTISVVGEGICFAINAASFLAVIGALTAMRTHWTPPETAQEGPIHKLREGARYVLHFHPVRVLLMLIALASLVSGMNQVLLPVFAKEIYHGTSVTFSLLSTAIAIGALASATLLAARSTIVGLGRWILIASATFAVSVALFGFTRSIYAGFPILIVMGLGMMMHMGATNTLIQSIVEDEMRGRVMAFYTMSFIGTMPIGSLLGGFLSSHFGPTATLLVGGITGLVGAAMFYRSLPEFRSVLKPIYEEKGILPAT